MNGELGTFLLGVSMGGVILGFVGPCAQRSLTAEACQERNVASLNGDDFIVCRYYDGTETMERFRRERRVQDLNELDSESERMETMTPTKPL